MKNFLRLLAGGAFLSLGLAAPAQITISLLATDSAASSSTSTFREFPLASNTAAFDYDFATQPRMLALSLTAPAGQSFRFTAGEAGLLVRIAVWISGTTQVGSSGEEFVGNSGMGASSTQWTNLVGGLSAAAYDSEQFYAGYSVQLPNTMLYLFDAWILPPNESATFTAASVSWDISGIGDFAVNGFALELSSSYLALASPDNSALAGSSFELYTPTAVVPEPGVAALLAGVLALAVGGIHRRRA